MTDEPRLWSEPDDEPRVVPEYEAAIGRNAASFTQFLEVTLGANPRVTSDEGERRVLERYVTPIQEAFEKSEGGIVAMFYPDTILAGSALTYKPGGRVLKIFKRRDRITLHVGNNETHSEDRQLLKLLGACEWLAINIRARLKGQDLQVAMRMVYGLVTDILSMINKRAEARNMGDKRPADGPLVEVAGEGLEEAGRFYERSAQRDAQIRYFGGMLIGMVLTGLLVWLVWRIDVDGFGSDFLVSFIAGAVGGIVSVMSRMTSGNIKLRYEAGGVQITAFGIFRPLIGAVFGAVLYFLFASEMLPLDIAVTGEQEQFFYAVVAFLGGFSERWAQDMLAASEGSLTPGVQTGERATRP